MSDTTLRAESWWIIRERFRKTWEVIINGKEYPLQELISIPNHPELIADLSKPLVKPNSERLITLESKQDMRKRGVASPDFGDMLAMMFAPEDPKEWWESEAVLNTIKSSVAPPKPEAPPVVIEESNDGPKRRSVWG